MGASGVLSVPETPGKEPGPWELFRGLERIEQRLTEFAAGYVPVAVFTTLVERVKDTEKDVEAETRHRISALEAESKARIEGDAALRKEIDDQRKVKAQQWFSIGLLGVGAVITLLVSIFRQGIGA